MKHSRHQEKRVLKELNLDFRLPVVAATSLVSPAGEKVDFIEKRSKKQGSKRNFNVVIGSPKAPSGVPGFGRIPGYIEVTDELP